MERERDVKIRIKRNYTFRPRGRKEKEVERFRLVNANVTTLIVSKIVRNGDGFRSPDFISFFRFLENEKEVEEVFSREKFFSFSFSFPFGKSKCFAKIMDRWV